MLAPKKQNIENSKRGVTGELRSGVIPWPLVTMA